MEVSLEPSNEGVEQKDCKIKADETMTEMQVVVLPTVAAASREASYSASAAAINNSNQMGENVSVATLSSKALKRCLSVPIPRSQPPSREVSPAPVFNIFAPRGRRYSASYSPARVVAGSSSTAGSANSGSGAVGCVNIAGVRTDSSRCVTPRISQLRQEECVDGLNMREVTHEREVHSAIQISQSWEDLSLVAENWSCKSSDELTNPLQVMVGGGMSSGNSCSSPSPTNNRTNLRLPYGLSPSPTRRSTFATRRSMSPIAIRPSQLGPVKRKFELDEGSSTSSWGSLYSQPPAKKMFCESRGSSPICQSPSGSVCPSPDSGTGTYDGRITPKLLISKLCTNNATNTNSACSSPMSASSCSDGIESTAPSVNAHCSSSSSSFSSSSSTSSNSSLAASLVSSNSEPMSIGSSLEETISIANKLALPAMQDESTLMDVIKPDTTTTSVNLETCTKMLIEPMVTSTTGSNNASVMLGEKM